jgi:hypothetical protein
MVGQLCQSINLFYLQSDIQLLFLRLLRFRLVAKYDLITLEPDGSVTIFD